MKLAAVAVVLGLCFSRPLYELVRFAWHDSFYSHILLFPFISLYLIWPQRKALAVGSRPAWGMAAVGLVAGLGLLAIYLLATHRGGRLRMDDYLAVMTLSFLSLLLSGAAVTLGRDALRTMAFPIAFLVFMAPFPSVVLHGIESFLQSASAEAAYAFLDVAGMSVLKDGMDLHMPGFSLTVAPECSGIHSTWVLFITSLVAGHLFLRKFWSRAALTIVVLPLAIVRNGLRIFTLGELCVNVDPSWIDSQFHHQGGPLWFALSLVPFFILLLLLRKWELRKG